MQDNSDFPALVLVEKSNNPERYITEPNAMWYWYPTPLLSQFGLYPLFHIIHPQPLPLHHFAASVNSSIDQVASSMHPTLLLLPLITSLLLLLVLQDNHVSADDCAPARCGNLTLRYPFWLGTINNQTSSPCGHPAFGVWCSDDGGGVAALRSSSIHVLTINYTTNSLVAYHNTVADDGACRANFNLSSSIALSPFTISSRNRALCFLFGCTGAAPTLPDYVNATSNCSAPIYAYLGGAYLWYSPPEIATGGCKYAYMPVLGTEAASLTAANYSRLLKDGFILEWDKVTVGDCPRCNASGGQCRYDNATAEFWCLCPGGRRAGSTCAGESSVHAYSSRPGHCCVRAGASPTYVPATVVANVCVDAGGRRRPGA
ncbi:hypothetical protein BS78_03G073000 [Paspalum vaginatum]|nr:hypothetical protein BS78_03G073000 [Paspalum vaginatum]